MGSTGERVGTSNDLKRTADNADKSSESELKKKKPDIAAERRNDVFYHRGVEYSMKKLISYKIKILEELKKLDERDMELDDKAEERALNRYGKFRTRLLECETLMRKHGNIARTLNDIDIKRMIVNNIFVNVPGWECLDNHADEFIRRVFVTKGTRLMSMSVLREIIDKVKAVNTSQTYNFPKDEERLQKLLNWVNWQIRDASMIHHMKILEKNLYEYPKVKNEGPMFPTCDEDPPDGEVSLQNRIFRVEENTPEEDGESIPTDSEDDESEGDEDELTDVEYEDSSDDESVLDMKKYCAISDDEDDTEESSTTDEPAVVNSGSAKKDAVEAMDGGTSTDSPSPVTQDRMDMPDNNIAKQNPPAATRAAAQAVPTVPTGPNNPPPHPVPVARAELDPRWALVLQQQRPVPNVVASTILLSDSNAEVEANQVDATPHRVPIQGLPVSPKLNPTEAWRMKVAQISQWIVNQDFVSHNDNEDAQLLKRDDEGQEGDDDIVCIDDDFEFDSVSHSGLQFKRNLKEVPDAPVETSDEHSVIELD